MNYETAVFYARACFACAWVAVLCWIGAIAGAIIAAVMGSGWITSLVIFVVGVMLGFFLFWASLKLDDLSNKYR